MRALLTALISGLVFGAGLVLSGMTQPAKVIGFLDVTGDWDPSLGLVMVGAIAVYSPVYHLIFARRTAAAGGTSIVPDLRVDARLVIGAVIFGVGWGIGGFCPGPGLVAAGGGSSAGLVFGASMLAGMALFRATQK